MTTAAEASLAFLFFRNVLLESCWRPSMRTPSIRRTSDRDAKIMPLPTGQVTLLETYAYQEALR
jgi:hypothetical protein